MRKSSAVLDTARWDDSRVGSSIHRSCRVAVTAAVAVVVSVVPQVLALAGQSGSDSGRSGPTSEASADKSDNVKLVASLPVPDGTAVWDSATDLDFSGRYAYMGRWNGSDARGEAAGGAYIYDIDGRVPKELSFVPCGGGQNDVAVVRPGLLALGYHRNLCGKPSGGITMIDVRDPQRPKVLGSVAQKPWGTHTLTAYPGKDLIYASPGGWGYEGEAEGGGDEYIIDVSNPVRPKVVATFDPKIAGCHDLSFRITAKSKLAFCAGDTMTQIWDVSDPVEPVVVSSIFNPLTGFNHSAEASPDGELLAVGEETFVDDCRDGFMGSVWVYDISDPANPKLMSYYSIPRGSPIGDGLFDYTCSAHNFRFIPGTRLLVAAWFQSGMNVLDLSDPAKPEEIAYFDPAEGSYWSAYWYNGRIYASGAPGLDVFEVKGLPE
ncbi:MAG: hypothetical protein M3N53_03640 [Actinomycetota bacterium]|nr:hypothetical protein [Actinomycetota bacterium]